MLLLELRRRALVQGSQTGEVMSVRLGTLDPGHHIRPTFRTFVDYAAAWEAIPEDGLERYPEGRAR